MCERCGCGAMKLARRRPAPLGKVGRWHVHADGTAHCHADDHDAAGGHAQVEAPRRDADGHGRAPGDEG